MDVEHKAAMPVRIVLGFGGLMGASQAEAEDQLSPGNQKAPNPEAVHNDEGRPGFIKLTKTPPDDS